MTDHDHNTAKHPSSLVVPIERLLTLLLLFSLVLLTPSHSPVALSQPSEGRTPSKNKERKNDNENLKARKKEREER